MASENGKFKVGDRVKYVGKHKSYCAEEHIGKVGTVTKTGVVGLPSVEFDDGTHQVGCYHDNLELVPAWQPKVGDLVRSLVDWCDVKKGETYAVVATCEKGVFVKVSGACNHYMSFKEVQPFTIIAPATLTIEAGKFYKTRDGRKVWPVYSENDYYVADGWHYNKNGECGLFGTHNPDEDYRDDKDIVALWEEPTQASNDNAAVAKPKFKVGDVVEVVRSRPGLTSKVGKRIKINRVTSRALYATCDGADNMVLYEDELELAGAALASSPAIVALIENGTPRPSTAPKVHTSQEAATTEAERLALEHPGQQFGVFVLADSKIADLVTTQTAVLRAA